MSSPTQRTMAALKQLGYRAAIVEHWNHFAKVRRDCFGVDILALKFGQPLLAIQTTTGANHAKRRIKLDAEGFLDLWKASGVQVEIWSWEKQGARGKRKLWTLRREAL